MKFKTRRLIFFIFLAIFCISAPIIVLYTAGYRLSLTTLRVQQTGVIALSSSPKGATVFINGVSTENKTPYVVQRLAPGTYTVTLEKDGYQPWNERVTVQSGITTYATATLFAKADPELLLPLDAIAVTGDREGRFIDALVATKIQNEISVVRFDTVTLTTRTLATIPTGYTTLALNPEETVLIIRGNEKKDLGISATSGAKLSEAELSDATNPLPGYVFIDNGSNTELRSTTSNTLVTLLPPSTYTVPYRDTTRALLSDTRGRTYLFTFASHAVTQINLPTSLVRVSDNDHLFAGTDGNEIDVYDPELGSSTLLARQSDAIVGLAWHTDEQSVLYATASSIIAVGRTQHEIRETTPIVSNATIQDMWRDTTGKNVTFFGTIDNTTGLWKVPLSL